MDRVHVQIVVGNPQNHLVLIDRTETWPGFAEDMPETIEKLGACADRMLANCREEMMAQIQAAKAAIEAKA